ncbi:MAG: hypothetical protein PHC61_15720 [Chitinivibrionales bacterium]|nr:hypothetical protein [Chitinivibrionales bacterium]
MKKVTNPSEIAEKLVADYRAVYGSDLVSMFLYGSAAGHEYRPGVSDINLGVVLADNSIRRIHQSMPIHKKWRSYPFAIPFFMTRAYISSSLDTFPIEFLDIKSSYRIIHGEDILAALPIHKEYLRLQCERELKSIALHLRKAYIESNGHRRALAQLLALSLKRLLPVFKAVLVLHDSTVPKNRSEIVLSVETVYSLGSSALSQVYALSAGAAKYKGEAADFIDLFDRYANIIDTIAESIDRMSNN